MIRQATLNKADGISLKCLGLRSLNAQDYTQIHSHSSPSVNHWLICDSRPEFKRLSRFAQGESQPVRPTELLAKVSSAKMLSH